MELEEFNRKIVPMRQELLSMARRQTGDEDLAEDSVQEVMLKLWSIRHELNKYGNTRALAIKMIRNWYIDHWRHSKMECHLKTDKDIATTWELGCKQSEIEVACQRTSNFISC